MKHVRFFSLLDKDAKDHRGINIVDLMMWLVIAALLLAAALQGIGYYKQAANVYLMQDEVTGVVADIHAAAAMNNGTVDAALINQVLTDHNNAHNKDDIVISYGSVTANASGLVSDSDYGFERSSVVTATSPSDVTYLRASSDSVQSAYVVYFFSPTRTFQQGLATVSKIRIDNGGFGEVTTPGTTQPTTTAPTGMADPASVPTPSATTTSAVPTPSASVTPTPTATATTAVPTPTPTATATSTPTQTVTPTPTPTPTPVSPIDAKYAAVNGATLMGAPTGPETAMATGGRYRDYTNGAIIWSSANGAFTSINGAIRDKWRSMGFENATGYPTSDDKQAANKGGTYQNFTGGAIISSSAGTYWTSGAIRDRWASFGFEMGPMGFPKTDEVKGLIRGGSYQNYQGGSILYSPATGAQMIYGAIQTAWNSQGYEGGRLGYPTSNEYDYQGGRAQNFEGGYITWTAAGGTVIH